MRAVIILCILATAYAGYEYGNQGGVAAGSGTEEVVSSGFENLSEPLSAAPQQFGAAAQQFGAAPQQFGAAPQQFGTASSQQSQQFASAPAQAEYSKEFYTYSAPEADFHDAAASNQLSSSLKKSLRVIFIRGPESGGIENAALELAKSASDDRTAIYVLNKQADTSDLANKLNQLKSHKSNRPEVHFVKYRTNADAEHAQHSIQSQYDSYQGSSSNHNGGVAPVLDFSSRGSAPASNYHGASAETSNSYLPPNRRI